MKVKQIQTWIVLGLSLSLLGCFARVRKVTGRDLARYRGRAVGFSRPIAPQEKAPKQELFVKQRSVKIEASESDSADGSLYHPGRRSNYLFLDNPPRQAGDYVTVRIEPREPLAGDSDDQEAQRQQAQDALIKAAPGLKPAAGEKIALKESIRFRIRDLYPNGDARLEYYRHSQSNGERRSMLVSALLPAHVLSQGGGLSTQDLLDVSYSEQSKGETINRNSAFWEDEYSLRFSGFSEARSELAKNLEKEKKNVERLKASLKKRLTAAGSDRNKMANERESLRKTQSEHDKVVEGLKDTIADRDSTIKAKDEEISQLNAEDASEVEPEP